MDAAMVTAVAALIGAPVAGLAAIYGSRVSGRAQREGRILTGYDSLTDQLQEERRELQLHVAELKADLAVEKAENARLRLLVQQLGGKP